MEGGAEDESSEEDVTWKKGAGDVVWERLDPLLALQMEEGDTNPGMWAASGI